MRYLLFGVMTAILFTLSYANAYQCVSLFQQKDQLLIKTPILKPVNLEHKEDLNVLIWNIYKTKKAGWERDFQTLLNVSDVAMLQEHLDGAKQRSLIRKNPEFEWNLVKAIKSGASDSGVATASRFKQDSVLPLLSTAREPIVGTPKSSLVSEISFQGKKVMLVNIHAINFVDLIAFHSQLSEVYQTIKDYKGPMVWAGDFNTWVLSGLNYRIKVLEHFADLLGLKFVSLENDTRWMPLDHVLVRGLKVEKASLLNNINSSDHYPILVKLRLE